jgi:hypothetical protein
MAKGAAQESKLAALHEILATVLIDQVGEQVEEELEDGTCRTIYTAQPALLTVAMKMLKDNDITCVPSEDSSVQTLADKLKERKKGHGKVIQLKPEGDEHSYG